MTSALVPLADGVEEMEAVIIVDMLRRAGWKVTTAGMKTGAVTASRGVRLLADCLWNETAHACFDVLALPGGKDGTRALCSDPRVLDAVREFVSSRKLVGAVCAAPLVLHRAGVLAGRNVTSHPSVAGELTGALWHDAAVVTDDRIVTSQGAGTTFAFALAIVRSAGDPETADRIAEAIVLRNAGPSDDSWPR